MDLERMATEAAERQAKLTEEALDSERRRVRSSVAWERQASAAFLAAT